MTKTMNRKHVVQTLSLNQTYRKTSWKEILLIYVLNSSRGRNETEQRESQHSKTKITSNIGNLKSLLVYIYIYTYMYTPPPARSSGSRWPPAAE